MMMLSFDVRLLLHDLFFFYVHSSKFSRDDSAAFIRGVMQSYAADPSVEYGGAT